MNKIGIFKRLIAVLKKKNDSWGIAALAREVTLSKMILFPLSVGVYSKKKEFAAEEQTVHLKRKKKPFLKGACCKVNRK